jgi:hypothetical protein
MALIAKEQGREAGFTSREKKIDGRACHIVVLRVFYSSASTENRLCSDLVVPKHNPLAEKNRSMSGLAIQTPFMLVACQLLRSVIDRYVHGQFKVS